MIIKFSTKKLNKLIFSLINDKVLIIIYSHKDIKNDCDLHMYFRSFIYNLEFYNSTTNDFIKEHHNIYKQFKSGISYIKAKEKYRERINFFMIKNKICFDIQNVILEFIIKQ